jgi:hypothetical protein
MKPELLDSRQFLDDLETTHEDRQDNRRAIAVAMIAAAVVLAGCIVLLLTHPTLG